MTDLHIYVDDTTGDKYIFNGKKLIKISGNDSALDQMDDENSEFPDLSAEDEEREKQAEKDRQEDNEDPESEEDRQDRLNRIRRFLDNDSVADAISAEAEQQVDIERQKKKAANKRDVEASLQGAEKNSHVMSLLAKDLGAFLARQVGKSQRTASWKKYNGNYDGSGIVRPDNRYEKVGKIPVLQIYLDQSGSWTDEDVKIANSILRSISEFERKKQLKTEVYYFSNHVHSDPQSARNEGGTAAGEEMMQQLATQKPDNVVVITDSDFDGYKMETNYTAPGGVWMIFKGARSKQLMSHLKGSQSTKYYDMDKV